MNIDCIALAMTAFANAVALPHVARITGPDAIARRMRLGACMGTAVTLLLIASSGAGHALYASEPSDTDTALVHVVVAALCMSGAALALRYTVRAIRPRIVPMIDSCAPLLIASVTVLLADLMVRTSSAASAASHALFAGLLFTVALLVLTAVAERLARAGAPPRPRREILLLVSAAFMALALAGILPSA